MTTEVEVLKFGLAPLTIKQIATNTFLNDLHHVTPTKQGVIVVNTGLDCLELFDQQLIHQSSISLIPLFNANLDYLLCLFKDDLRKSWRRIQTRRGLYKHLSSRIPFRNIWKLFSPMGIRQSKRDLRYYDLRPHFLHPNHVTLHGDAYWVTLWRPGIVIRVPDGQIIASGLGRPHDGIIVDEEYLVTDCKNSRVIIFDMKGDVPGATRLIANVMPPEEGFLRGIVARDENIFAGLSAFRGEKQFPNGRILVLDRSTCKIQDSWAIPIEFGNSVFSILDVTQFYA